MKKRALFSLSLPMLAMALAACGGGGQQTSTDSKPSGDSGAVSSVDASSGGQTSQGGEAGEDVAYNGKLKIYYHNDAGNYANKRIWAWGNGVDGDEYPFDNQTSADDYGVYKIFDLSEGVWKDMVSTTFSFIIKEAGTWAGQSTDTICHFSKFISNMEDGVVTIFACDGEGGNIDTFATKKEALGDRIGSAYFTDWKTLHVVGAGANDGRAPEQIGLIDSYELYAYDAEYQSLSLEEQSAAKSKYLIAKSEATSVNKNALDIKLDKEVVPNLAYTIEARMSSDTSRVKSKMASFNALFDTETFRTKYTYTGNDLGCTASVAEKKATFKLWAPTSSRVQVRIYTLGTPGDMFDTFIPTNNNGKNYEMTLGEHGVWQVELTNFPLSAKSPKFYTYYVTNAGGTNEIIDPYAVSTGLNGKRGAIIDWSTIEKPEGWDNIKSGGLLTDISRPNELSVYEAHIRDLTADKTWTGKEIPGTYNAFVESGTTYENVTTGFDHIREMGMKAIQLLPVFDQDNDERWADKEGKLLTGVKEYRAGMQVTAPAYNWGYNPQNYNSPEGAYSSNPCDGITKVNEFRNLVQQCANNDIRVIMDVVYNHFASVNGHPLNRIVPGYFLRMSEDGSAYDGTGCGNVTATERPMMRKFVVDSVKQWATNYKVKGFRFDLMGCIDVGTMRAVKDALYEIDPDIVVYGEGWAGLGDGGFGDVVYKHYPNTKPDNWPANTSNVYSKLYDNGKGSVGCFNDCFRDSMKGNTVYDDIIPGGGFLTGDVNNSIKKGLGEGVLGASDWHGYNNEQSVNFAACHDNYTVFDQLNYKNYSATAADKDNTANNNVIQACVAANATALLNQGIAFINGGDEIFRQKVMTKDNTDAKLIAKMEESIRTETAEWDDDQGHHKKNYKVGDGVKMSSGNYLVRNSYQYGDGVNSYKWDRKVKFLSYYEQIKEASLVRNQTRNNIFGRAYSEISERKVNNVFNSTYDSDGYPMVACYAQGKKDSANYYIIIGGKFDDEAWKSLSCANCDIEVIYSSSKAHKKGDKFTINNGLLGAGSFEYLLVKAS